MSIYTASKETFYGKTQDDEKTMIQLMRHYFYEPNLKNNRSQSDDSKHKPNQKIDEGNQENCYMKMETESD
jgi:hypothetical protein